MDLTNKSPEEIKALEASAIQAILPKLPGLKKLIAVVEARAKELLESNPEVFNNEWILKEGSTQRKVLDNSKFIAHLLSIENENGHVLKAEDIFSVASFSLASCEKLLMEKMQCSKKEATTILQETDAIEVSRKAPTLVQCK